MFIETQKHNQDSIKKETLKKKIYNRILFLIGSISLVFGIIGIFFPILPTTPFLLLTAALYARSSKKFYNWLLNNRILGFYIRNYREGKGMPFMFKLITIMLLWATILITIIFFINILWVQILLMTIAIVVSIHISLIKPKEKSG